MWRLCGGSCFLWGAVCWCSATQAPLVLMVFLWNSSKGFRLWWIKTYLLFSRNAWTLGSYQWAAQEQLSGSLLPKKGGLGLLKNWRPVSLLCTDYKILAKVLSTRLKGGIEEIVYKDQIFHLPDCTIMATLFLVCDLIDVSKFGSRTAVYWSSKKLLTE